MKGRRGRRRNAGDYSIRSLCILPLLLLLLSLLASSPVSDASPSVDPYKILGVTRESNSKEIQKQYRKLCLKYHPDKNRHLSPKDKQRCEEKFKTIQKAYSLIGDEKDRKNYDFESAFRRSSPSSSSFSYRSSSSPYGTDPVAEAFFRAFQGVNAGGPGFGVRRPFFASSTNPTMPADLSLKSIYVQKVYVPLPKLYKGAEVNFSLVDNLWTRWRAAWRGKIALLSLYQGLMYSLPVVKTSKFVAFVIGLVVAHATLPSPDPRQQYRVRLGRGTKGGKTKVRFASTKFGIPEVVFEIVEAPHKLYKRKGNDLHIAISITPEQAKKGETFEIPSLDDEEDSIQLTLQPNEIKSSGDTVRIVGKGWPIKNSPDVYLKGDIVVRVMLHARRKRKRFGFKTKPNKGWEYNVDFTTF